MRPGDRVVVNPDYPGVRANVLGRVYVVDRVNPKNVVCRPEDGVGRGINYPKESLLPATDENIAKAAAPRPYEPREFFTCGEIVTTKVPVKGREADEPFIVLKDDGNKVNIALLGGDNDRYWRMPASGLVKRDRTWLAGVIA